VNANEVKKLVFVSGKHFYTLKARRDELNRKDVGIIRIESLCPFPTKELQLEIQKYKNMNCEDTLDSDSEFSLTLLFIFRDCMESGRTSELGCMDIHQTKI